MGCRDSFIALLDEYGPRVLRIATRILRDPQQAQDVHQDVFLEIWRRWGGYNGQVNWSAYLYRATVRNSLAARKCRTRPAAEPLVAPWSPQAGPESSLQLSELRDRLADKLAQLPDHQALAFVLSRMEGLGYDEVSAILECSPETARVHVHRAMKRLAQGLAAWIR